MKRITIAILGCRFDLRQRSILWPHPQIQRGRPGLGLAEPGGNGLCHRHLQPQGALGVEWRNYRACGRLHLLLFALHDIGTSGDTAAEFLRQCAVRADD